MISPRRINRKIINDLTTRKADFGRKAKKRKQKGGGLDKGCGRYLLMYAMSRHMFGKGHAREWDLW